MARKSASQIESELVQAAQRLVAEALYEDGVTARGIADVENAVKALREFEFELSR